MVLAERPSIPIDSVDTHLVQGVCIIETGSSKRFYFTSFTQYDVNISEEARTARQELAPDAVKASTLGRVYSSRAVIPWGPGLQHDQYAIKEIVSTLNMTDHFLQQNEWRGRDPKINDELDVIKRIRKILDQFPKEPLLLPKSI